jgi:hypothetical protein
MAPPANYSLKTVDFIQNLPVAIGVITTQNNQVSLDYKLNSTTGQGYLVLRALITDQNEAQTMAQEVRNQIGI